MKAAALSMHRSLQVLALSLLSSGPLAAQASDGIPVEYELAAGSTVTIDCFVCELAYPTQAIEGTFRLVRTSAEGDPAARYRVESVLLRSEHGLQVRATGTYTQDGEVALLQSMELDASLDEGPIVPLTSGQAAVTAAFPALDITVQRGDPPDQTIFITSIHLIALPADVTPPPPRFRRGDADANGAVNIADAIRILNWRFSGGEAPSCEDTADVDDDEKIDITDAISLLSHLFLGGQAPAAPGPSACGESPSPLVGCAAYPGC